MTHTADVAVIGGGSTGCSIAYHLAASGFRVILIERGKLACGATGQSPGVVRQYYASPELGGLALTSLRMFDRWRRDLGDVFGYRPIGVATGVANVDEAVATSMVDKYKALGSSIEIVELATVATWYDDFVSDGLACIIYEPDAGYCDTEGLTRAVASEASKVGAVIWEQANVESVCLSNGSVMGVQTSKGAVSCPIVVNAAGAWAHILADGYGAPIPIEMTRQCVAEVSVREEIFERRVLAYTESPHMFYMRPTDRGTYLVGSHSSSDSRVIAAHDFKDGESMNEADVLRFADRAASRFGRFGTSSPYGSRVSVFDNTPDGNPILGADPRIDGLFIAAGLSGHGFKFCPVFGFAMAGLIKDQRTSVDVKMLSIERFL